MHFPIYFGNLTFVFFALLTLGGCGWFVVAPFKQNLTYPVLVAPFAGILMLSLAALAGYVFLKLPMSQAGIAALGATLGLSLLAVEWKRPWRVGRPALLTVLLAVLVCVLVVRLTTAASLQLGETAMLYADGTDHLGYAHLADWLSSHRVTVRPVLSSGLPYESWPNLLLQIDPRFGSHTFLALIALATGHSAMFAYDLTLTLVVVASMLAVAGTYARSMRTLWLLTAGLLVCHWFDYSRSGYLGKCLGYPSVLLVAGLYLRTAGRSMRVPELVGLVALAAAGSLMHSGLPLALLVGLVGVVHLCGVVWFGRREGGRFDFTGTRDQALGLALVLAAALLTAGTLARPLSTGYPDWNLDWSYVFPRVADLESQGIMVSGLSSGWLSVLTVGLLGLGLAGMVVAVVYRVPAALALLVGPLGLLAVLYGLDARAVAFQLIGTFYPLGLCGLAILTDELAMGASSSSPRSLPAARLAPVVFALGLVAVAMHVPRFLGAAVRYGSSETTRTARFSERQMNELAEFIGRSTVDVDIPNSPQLNLTVLVELGRRGVLLQWQPRSWSQILAYQPWEHPSYASPGTFRLVAAGETPTPAQAVVFRTEQYLLLRPVTRLVALDQ
jgi:hypothetical protein